MFAQVIANTVIRASELGLLAVGVTMIFSVLRFANFAQGGLAVVGAYTALAFVDAGIAVVPACALGVLVAGLFAVICDQLLFRQIRKSPGLILLIASIGLSIFIRNVVGAIWGVRALSFPTSSVDIYVILGARVTGLQVWIAIIAVSAMAAFHGFLYHTRFGKALRALSDDRDLAQTRGINVERAIPVLWLLVGAYAGLAGILVGMDTVLTTEMGYNIMLPVFCAAILGGIGSIYGAILGSIIIGLAENVLLAVNWSWLISIFGLLPINEPYYIPTGYKVAVSFVILLLALIFMPRGIMKGGTGD